MNMLKSFAFLDTTWFIDGIKFPMNFMGKYIIRKFYESEFKYKDQLKEWELSTYHSTGSHDYIIEVIDEFERHNYQKILYSLKNIISLIRLTKYNRTYFSKIVCFENGRVTMSGSLDEPRPSSFSSDEKLSESDIKTVKKIVENVKALQSPNERVFRALHFWDSSNCSGSFEQKAVDLFIALESLFTVESEETTYRLSNRMSWFSEQADSKKRLGLFKQIKIGYGIRSRVVHGKKFVESEELVLIQKLHSLTRDILLRILLDAKLLRTFSANDQDLILSFNKLVLGYKDFA